MSVYHQRLQRRRSRGAVGCPPVPRRCRGLTESVTARAVSRLHRDQSRGIVPLAQSSLQVAVERRHRRCSSASATARRGCWSAARTRFQLTPDAVRGWAKKWHAPQGGAAVDALPECASGGASAAHQRRLLCPRRGRGLTEGVTARAVGQRLWSSGVPPARRQQGRVESRHVALRSAYRVMAECRRSATMSADVDGDALQRERGGGECRR